MCFLCSNENKLNLYYSSGHLSIFKWTSTYAEIFPDIDALAMSRERGPCEASKGTARAESQRATEAHSSRDQQKNTKPSATEQSSWRPQRRQRRRRQRRRAAPEAKPLKRLCALGGTSSKAVCDVIDDKPPERAVQEFHSTHMELWVELERLHERERERGIEKERET